MESYVIITPINWSAGVLSSFFINTPGEGEYHLTGVVIIPPCSEVVSPMLLPSHCCGRGNVWRG